MPKLLNVGGNNKSIPLPGIYEGWEHIMLDIDPLSNPDVVCDARKLASLPGAEYEAVYCSHNLEHYYRHDVIKVLHGFHHVLKNDGFTHIRVPDMGELMAIAVKNNLDIDDTLYQSSAGPITVGDFIYGYGVEIERSGNDFFAHKTGFTKKSLSKFLIQAGFPHMFLGMGMSPAEINILAFKEAPSRSMCESLGLVPPA